MLIAAQSGREVEGSDPNLSEKRVSGRHHLACWLRGEVATSCLSPREGKGGEEYYYAILASSQ